MNDPMIKQIFQKEENRIYINDELGRLIAEITFPETEPGVFTINHTFVDPGLRGQGIASDLVKATVEEIGMRNGVVRATCSYAVKWLNDRA